MTVPQVDEAVRVPRAVISLSSTDTLADAIRMMHAGGVHHVVVTRPGSPPAIASAEDVLTAGLADPDGPWEGALPLEKAARAAGPVLPDTNVTDAIDQMYRAGATAIPVVDHDGRLVGVLTTRDLLRLASHLFDQPSEPLPELSDQTGVATRLLASPVVQQAITLLNEIGL